VAEVRLDLVFDQAWTKDMMSEAAKLALVIEAVIPSPGFHIDETHGP